MYKLGVTKRVIVTDDKSPKIIATARDENIGSRHIQSGNMPPMVVSAVRKIVVILLLVAF